MNLISQEDLSNYIKSARRLVTIVPTDEEADAVIDFSMSILSCLRPLISQEVCDNVIKELE